MKTSLDKGASPRSITRGFAVRIFSSIQPLTVGIIISLMPEPLSSTKPFTPFMKVENISHYKDLSLLTLSDLSRFSQWEIDSIKVQEIAIDSIVKVHVSFSVPYEHSIFESEQILAMVFEYKGDSLTNYGDVHWIDTNFDSVDSLLESRELIKLFLAYEPSSSVLLKYFGKSTHGITLNLASETGDTLVFRKTWFRDSVFNGNQWIKYPTFARYLGFTIKMPLLLEQLEQLLFPFSVPQISVFRNNVGIKYARLFQNHLCVSSNEELSGTHASFSASHSGGYVTSFELPYGFDWNDFRNYSNAITTIKTYLLSENFSRCEISGTEIDQFVWMSYSPNYPSSFSSRRIYVPISCNGSYDKICSVPDNKDSMDNDILFHDLNVIDSLYVYCM